MERSTERATMIAALVLVLIGAPAERAGRVAEDEQPAAAKGGSVLPMTRLEGVQTTLAMPDGRVMHASADAVETAPARLFGPLRLGFLRVAIASDVSVDYDARRPASRGGGSSRPSHIAAPPLNLGNVVRLEVNGFTARMTDASGGQQSVRAHQCTMDGKTSFTCFGGVLQAGSAERPFDEARFDGSAWRIVHGPAARADVISTSSPGTSSSVSAQCASDAPD